MRVAFPCCGFVDFWPKLACDLSHPCCGFAGFWPKLACDLSQPCCGFADFWPKLACNLSHACCGFAGFWPKLACDHYLQCELSVKTQRMFCHILHPAGSMIVRYEFFLNHFTHAEGRNRLIGRALRPSPKETSLAPHG